LILPEGKEMARTIATKEVKSIWLQEETVNASEGYSFGPTEPYESKYDTSDSMSRIFRDLSREYGRCTGKVFIDVKDESKPIGWVFLKRDRYEDTHDYYLRETWITLHSAPAEHKTIYHYL
jgi:hypothetical protein